VQALIAIPGALIGLALSYWWGARVDRQHGIDHGFTRAGSHWGWSRSERGPGGFTIHWGRVLAWDPLGRVVFTWQIAGDRIPQPDPDKASEVEVRFSGEDGATRVDVEHRAWERHGDGTEEYRAGFEQAGAWPYALERFAEAARGA
jgi:Activator of Hsp90 ATPase homolog 1-like protein